MKKIGNSHGITMVSLVVTIVVMMILTISITTSVTSTLELQKYNKVKEDIIALSEEVKNYYMKNAKLPAYTDKTFDLVEYNVPSDDTNPNDSGAYYAIDLSVLSANLEINCGAGNKNKDWTTDDLYVLNEESLTVYYLKGAILNGVKHYTIIDDFSGGSFASEYYKKVDLPIISVVTIESNGSDKTKATKDDIVTLKFLSNYDYTTKPTVTIDGQDVTDQCQWNGRLCTVNYEVASIKYLDGDSKVGEKVEFSISNYTADDRTGKEITDVTFGQNVYFSEGYVVDGVEIPRGFVYVGGTKDSGLVISDNASDKDKYKNREVVGTDLVGNQFVWVPVENIADYKRKAYSWNVETSVIDTETNSIKIEYNSNDHEYYTEKLDDDEKKSIEQYKGYYIGRYTVGDEQSTKNKTQRQSDSLITNNTTIKAGQAPFTWITYAQAKEIAEKFGLNNKYKTTTKLTNSYAWDTAIAFIEKNNRNYGSSSEEGNYINTTFTYTDISGSKVTKPINTSTIVPTGQTTSVCNIYDMGGNVQEWSTENIISEKNYHTIRGGDSRCEYAVWGAGNRNAAYDEKTYENVGFRITMYM